MVIDPAVIAAWIDAASSPDALATIERLHNEIAREVSARRPVCVRSGRCCGFESYGHRLYLTGLETAWTWLRLPTTPTPEGVLQAMTAGTCPFLADGCSVHQVRPAGCRIYYCDPDPTGWQNALAERCHDEVRRLHERLSVEYRYAEWRELLGAFAAHPKAS